MGLKEERTREENLAIMAGILATHGFPGLFNFSEISRCLTETLPYCVVVTFKDGSPGINPTYVVKYPDASEFNIAYIIECLWLQEERHATLVRRYMSKDEIVAIDKAIAGIA